MKWLCLEEVPLSFKKKKKNFCVCVCVLNEFTTTATKLSPKFLGSTMDPQQD